MPYKVCKEVLVCDEEFCQPTPVPLFDVAVPSPTSVAPVQPTTTAATRNASATAKLEPRISAGNTLRWWQTTQQCLNIKRNMRIPVFRNISFVRI